MTRRTLLSLLALAAADPERLLWTPGRKLISIPDPLPGWQPEYEVSHKSLGMTDYDYVNLRIHQWFEEMRANRGLGPQVLLHPLQIEALSSSAYNPHI